MKYKPHSYQRYAIDFILAHPIAAILLDMGMGKTSLTLMAILLLLDSFEAQKILIVAPLRVAKHTWKAEIEKWDEFKSLRYSIVVGTAKERVSALKADADIYIINRENIPWLIEKSGVPFDFDMVVLDELSSFKSHTAARHKALMKVRPKVKRIIGLTGTPTGSGGYMDLFGEYKVLDMGQRLGRFIGQYRSWYFRPLATNGHIVYSYGLLPGAEDLINEKIKDITVALSAVDHLDMPEKISTTYPVYMDEAEKRKYEEMKDDLILQTEEGEVTAANAAALSGKLSQMANGAVYTDDEGVEEIHQKKLDALEDIIEASLGKPVLVVYWYRHDRERIEARLKERKVLYGTINSDESIELWNSGKLSVGLAHPASSGHGLNLQESGSNTMVFFGIPWSVELYQQTVARLWRQGQKHRTVSIIHIVTKGTIDERIMKALDEGNTTQATLIEAVKAQF
jgi:SNF2 family DNA or RNA helicase